MNKKTTLKLNRDFRRLYYKGSSAVHPLIVTYASKNRLGYNRIGITVTKKIGTAVMRNRVKRVLRECFRLHQALLPPALDLVIVPKRQLKPEQLTLAAASRELVPLMRDLRDYVLARRDHAAPSVTENDAPGLHAQASFGAEA